MSEQNNTLCVCVGKWVGNTYRCAGEKAAAFGHYMEKAGAKVKKLFKSDKCKVCLEKHALLEPKKINADSSPDNNSGSPAKAEERLQEIRNAISVAQEEANKNDNIAIVNLNTNLEGTS